ncbi:MAG: hypothetical protein QOD77_2081 [Thermoplasmata archaeon]|jgi:Raf kinase inhibitor-like YbhB/YbcL family protein|nr:hypothetical protein [Thermoplasmata archaeon]
MAFTLLSSDFKDGEPIPARFTCQGRGKSPALTWSGEPHGTHWFALVMDDPDAPGGTWTHWTWWDLPLDEDGVAEGADVARLGAVQGMTSAKSVGWHGPCPPSGTHRYVFTLHALRGRLGLAAGATVEEVHAALKAKSLGSARLMGTYQKS